MTPLRNYCSITLVIVSHCRLAIKFFYRVTIAHDKGKPAARWGRKAVSLSGGQERGNSLLRFERLSGCRRRSKRAKTSACCKHHPYRVGESTFVCSGKLLLDNSRALLYLVAVVAESAQSYSHLLRRRFTPFHRIQLHSVQRQEIFPLPRSMTRKPRLNGLGSFRSLSLCVRNCASSQDAVSPI